MAESGGITPVGSPGAAGSEDDVARGNVSFEDGKGEKKKKFKPLEKMMKFFKSGKKRSKSKERDGITSVKAKSTSALHKDVVHSEDEDDAGFRRVPMGGTRSMSEDSVFHPEQRDPSLSRKTAVSMEDIKHDFRSELFTKLQRRRALSSDDEVDDNNSFYLYSSRPSRHYNAADIVMGRPKPLPAAGKSHSADSDISFGDNDTGDLFKTRWEEAVGPSSSHKSKSSADSSSFDMDLNAVKADSETLVSEAAKHKISIKPKARRAASIHRRGTRPGGSGALPQLKEESPVKEIPSPEEKPATPKEEKVKLPVPVPEPKPVQKRPSSDEIKASSPETVVTVLENKTSIQISAPKEPVEDVTTETTKRQSMHEGQPGAALLPTSPDALQGVKLRKQRPKSMIDPPKPDSDGGGGNELAKAFQKRLSVRKEHAEGEVSAESFKEPTKDVVEITSKISENKSNSSTSPVSTSSTGSTSGVSYALKKEPLRKTSAPESSNVNSRTPVLKSVSEESSSDDKKVTVVKSEEEKTSVSVEEKSKSLSNKLASPREEYRLKRQARSKTLPEQPVSREILDASMSASTTTTTKSENKFSRSLTANKPETAAKVTDDSGANENKVNPTVSPIAKRVEPKRLSMKGVPGTSDSSGTPSWIAMARKKQSEPTEDKSVNEDVKKEPLSAKSSSDSSTKVTPEPSKTSEGSKESHAVRTSNTNFSRSFTGSSVKSSGTSSKEEKELINGNKKGPETIKKDTEPVQRTMSLRTKPSDSKNIASSTPLSSVPQWRKDLAKKNQKEPQVKIEIIEKEKPKPVPPKKPTKALDENTSVSLREKKVTEKCGDTLSNRQSKVLDMVKNFQKLQVS